MQVLGVRERCGSRGKIMKTITALLLFAAMLPAQQAAPEVQISVNGARQADLPQGWPLLVHGIVMNSQRFRRNVPVDPVRLAPRGMAWTDSIKLNIHSPGAADTTWDLKLTGLPGNPELNIASTTLANLTWRMIPAASAGLVPGIYQVTAVLEVIDSDGWTGKVRSVPIVATVLPVSSSLTPDQEVEHAMLLMRSALLDGNPDDAEAAIQGLLQSQPTSIPALQAMAGLLEQRGLNLGAYIYAHQALFAFYDRYPNAQEPPEALLAAEARLRPAPASQ
jgi:hypothetical protein